MGQTENPRRTAPVAQRSVGSQVARVWARPQGKIALGLAVALVVALFAGAIYVFGAAGGTPSGPLTSATLVATNGGSVFMIDPSSSEASFTMSEVLLGKPNTVVGKTNSVAGQILVNMKDPTLSQVGQIKVDLSTLATDNDFRNRTMQGRILETGDPANQYAVFTPTAITGLPSALTLGQSVSFHITGNLTIHQVTKAVTFDAQVTPQSATQISGAATTTVRYEDFNLAIPNVPSVTDVSDDVKLALTFTAHA
ncbi:MAG TPA: YceI family protein [Ktedonobacterales bacterium]